MSYGRPATRRARTGSGLPGRFAKRTAHARVVFELATEQPEQVGQAIHIGEDRRLHAGTGLLQTDERRSARRQIVRATS